MKLRKNRDRFGRFPVSNCDPICYDGINRVTGKTLEHSGKS